jgi:hypothetical protein
MKTSVARFLFVATALFGQRVMAQTEAPVASGAATATEAAPAAEAAAAPATADPGLAAKVADLEAKLQKVEAAAAERDA